MPRGQTAIPIQIPTRGIIANTPPHLAPPGSLVAGYNVFVDIDGQLKARRGYLPFNTYFPAYPTAPSPIGDRLHGGISWSDPSGAIQYVVADNTSWWSGGSGSWINISGAPLVGTANDPARFAIFPQGTPQTFWAIGVDNASPMNWWNSGLSYYQIIQNAPIARDICVLANRVVVINTVEDGTRYPRRVRWSSVNDATTWGTLNYIDLLQYSDPLVGIAPMGPNIAAVYGEQSLILLYAIAGDDANAFIDQPVYNAQGIPGPCSPAVIVSAEGQQYYLGTDCRVYAFNGTGTVPASEVADPAFINIADFTNLQKSHGAYLASQRHVWFFFPTTTATPVLGDPSVAEVIDLKHGAILVPQTFSEGITASFPAQVQSTLTWENSPFTWETNPYTWGNSPSENALDLLTTTAGGEVDTFFMGAMDGLHNYLIPYSATWPYFTGKTRNERLMLTNAEIWLQPNPGYEIAAAEFTTLNYPFDPGTPLVSFALQVSAGWTSMPVEPGPFNPANIRNNFLMFRLWSPQSMGTLEFGGGTLWCNFDTTGQYGNQ